jgi:hypothetical protein
MLAIELIGNNNPGSSTVTTFTASSALPHRILKISESLGLGRSSMMKYNTPSSHTGSENESIKNCLSSKRNALTEIIHRHFRKVSRSWGKNPS